MGKKIDWAHHPLEEKCWDYAAVRGNFNEAVETFIDDAQKKGDFEETEILGFLKSKLESKIFYAKQQVEWVKFFEDPQKFFEENEENILLV